MTVTVKTWCGWKCAQLPDAGKYVKEPIKWVQRMFCTS